MQDRLERLIKSAYRKWKSAQPKLQESHPDEESLACFLEGKLDAVEDTRIKSHVINCDRCAQIVAIQARLETGQMQELPSTIIERVKNIGQQEERDSALEIILRLKEKLLELVNTTGDVLVGQELIPAPVLRSRQIKDFKDEVTIFKDFKDIRVEVKIENKGQKVFDMTVVAKEKYAERVIKDLRITLIKDDLELESYLSGSGKATFEHISLGKYTVEIIGVQDKVASILLDIKI